LSIDPDIAETGQPYSFTGDDPLNSTDPLGLESEKQFLTYLSHHKKSVAHYFEYRASLSRYAIEAYIKDFPGQQQAEWVNSHKAELIATPFVAGAVGLGCAFGGCEALLSAAGLAGPELSSLDDDAAQLSETEQATYDGVVNDANKMSHIFRDEHLLDPLVEKYGSAEGVVAQVSQGLSSLPLPTSGIFVGAPLMIGGQPVVVNGTIINGIPRIGTFYTPGS
jgi:hypothetical protein